jgi:hypothetical protein
VTGVALMAGRPLDFLTSSIDMSIFRCQKRLRRGREDIAPILTALSSGRSGYG